MKKNGKSSKLFLMIAVPLAILLAAVVAVVAIFGLKEQDEPVVENNPVKKDVSIDFEDGKYSFIGVDKVINPDGDDFIMTLEDYEGSKALKCMPDEKLMYVGIQAGTLLGESASKLRTVEMDLGIQNPSGTFYAASGFIYLYSEANNLDTPDSASWSVYAEEGNPKTVSYALPEDYTFAAEDYIIVSLETDVGKDKGDIAANLLIDNIAFKDADGNVLKVDTSVEFVGRQIETDRNNLWDLTDIVEFEGFVAKAGAWLQDGHQMPQKIINALKENAVIEISFTSASGDLWLVFPDAKVGWTRVGCPHLNSGTGYYNDAKNIVQIPFELIVEYLGEDVSTWGDKLQCESMKDWQVHSVKVGQRVPGTGPDVWTTLYILKDRVYLGGVEDMEIITKDYGVTGIHLYPKMLRKLKDGGAIEVEYEVYDENTILWFAGEGETEWQMLGGPIGHGTERTVRRNKENTVVQITYETLKEHFRKGWVDKDGGYWMMFQANGKCRVKSIQIGKVGTGENTWVPEKPLYVLKDRIYLSGVESMETISKGWDVTGIHLTPENLAKLKDGGALEVRYESQGKKALLWFAGNGNGDKWQMIGGPIGSDSEDDVRRDKENTIVQISYEMLCKYLKTGWADNKDGYWMMFQCDVPCKITSIQIGKIGTGSDTWIPAKEDNPENKPGNTQSLYTLYNVAEVQNFTKNIDKGYGLGGFTITKEIAARLKKEAVIEITYKCTPDADNTWMQNKTMWFAGNNKDSKWTMVGYPAEAADACGQDELIYNDKGTIVQVTFETLDAYLKEGWNAEGSYLQYQVAGACTIESIKVGSRNKDDVTIVEPEEPDTPDDPGEGEEVKDRNNLYALKNTLDITTFTTDIAQSYSSGDGFTVTDAMSERLFQGAVIEIEYECAVDSDNTWMGNKTFWFGGVDNNDVWHKIGCPADGSDVMLQGQLRWNDAGTIVQITYEQLNECLRNGWKDAGSWIAYQAAGSCTVKSVKVGLRENAEDRTGLYELSDTIMVTGFSETIASSYGSESLTLTAEMVEKLGVGAVIEIQYAVESEEWMQNQNFWFCGSGKSGKWQMIGFRGTSSDENTEVVGKDEVKWNATGTVVQITYETLNKYLATGWNVEGEILRYQAGGAGVVQSVTIGMREIQTPPVAQEDRTNLLTLTDTVDVTDFTPSFSAAYEGGGFSIRPEWVSKLVPGSVIEVSYECTGETWMANKTFWFTGNDKNDVWHKIGFPADDGGTHLVGGLKWNNSGTIVQITYEQLNEYLKDGWNTDWSWIGYMSGGPCTIKSVKIGMTSSN